MSRSSFVPISALGVLTSVFAFGQEAARVLVPSPPSSSKVSGQIKASVRPASPNPKLSERLRSAAQARPSIRLLITLLDQPLSETYRALEAAKAFEQGNAEAAFQAEASKAAPDKLRLARAREARDAAVLSLRSQVSTSVERRVQPQQDEMEAFLAGLGATDIRRIPLLNMVAATIPAAILSLLESDPRILEISRDEDQGANLVISVPALGATAFWNAGFTGVGESVVVLDSGLNVQHPAFGGTATSTSYVGASCPEFERSPADFNGHGTHVAGIVASQGTAALPQYKGVAPGLRLVAAKISCANGRSFSSDALNAVTSVLAVTPATVINNSNGGDAFVGDDSYARAIDLLIDTYNLVWVNAAGNSGPLPRTITSPGIAYNAITVGNIDTRRTVARNDDVIANSSSRGPTMDDRYKPDLVAPGTNIASTNYLTDGFLELSGTSMASPHIAGAAALLRDAGLSGKLSIKALLINTTDSSTWSPTLGWGSTNLTRAFAQRTYGLSSALSSSTGDFKLYRGTFTSAGDLFATLTWDRTYRTNVNFLRDLDLHAYDASGALRAESVSVIQNVEQVGVSHAAETFVLKVRAEDDGRGFNEPFAVALSNPGFTSMTGPVVGLTCSAPTQVASGATFTVNCTLTNTGDTTMRAPTIVATISDGDSQSFVASSNINVGANLARSFQLTAPTTGASFTLGVNANTEMFEERFVSNGLRTTISLIGGQLIKPAIAANGVVNAASSQAGLSSSQWVTIVGSNLAPVTRTLNFVNGAYPTSANGISITVDGKAAFLYYLSPTQINIVTPDLTRSGTIPIVITRDGVASDPINVVAQSTSPAAFLWPGGYAVATGIDYSYKVRPGTFQGLTTAGAKPGEIIILWTTGLGPTTPTLAAGRQVPSNQLYSVASAPSVTIGGARADVLAAALAPGNAALYQIALYVPDLPNGDHAVITTVNGVASVAAKLTVQR
ncbi:MAG: S8 family serine peptidase [Bryobacteraceae bacterium]